MSADELRRRVELKLVEVRDAKVKNLRRCKPRPPTVMQDGTQISAAGVEEIALFAVDTNAWIDALNLAMETIDDEYTKMTAPVVPKDENVGEKQEHRQVY